MLNFAFVQLTFAVPSAARNLDSADSYGYGLERSAQEEASVERARTTRSGLMSLYLAFFILLGPGVNSAWAYLDPGTGSMILQLMLGGVAGLLVVGKLYLARLRKALRYFRLRKQG